MKTSLIIGTLLEILKVIPRTLFMAAVIMGAGIIFGTCIALIRRKAGKAVNAVLNLFLAYVRGTPMVVQMLIVYYSLPVLLAAMANGIFGTTLKSYDIPNVVSIYVPYIINVSFHQSEHIRGALKSVEKGQEEAALAMGLLPFQTFIRIVAPQALAVAIPGFVSYYMSVIKMLSLAFMLEVVDILAAAKLYASRVSVFTECYIAAALVYWVLSIIFTYLANWAEVRIRKGAKV